MEKEIDNFRPQASEEVLKEFERRIHRSAAAKRVFAGADGELMLDEIKRFCGGDGLMCSRDLDLIQLATRAGKRDVWQFIQNILTSDAEKAQKELDNARAKKERE